MFDTPRSDNNIFSAESTLSTGYTPDAVDDREAEIAAIAAAVRPLTRRQSPENLIVYGPAGVGKTITVNYVCNQLDDQTRTHIAYLNCWQYNTRAALLSQLLIELGYPSARKGKPVDELLVKLHEWLDKHHNAVIVLDEFDQHRDQPGIINDLHHLAEDAENELGLILISNQPPGDLELNPRSTSRLQYRVLQFQGYDVDGLTAILQGRAEKAFRSDAITEDALTRIAERAAANGGDCRHALELLHRAGRIAERENADTVAVDHVTQSVNTIQE